MNRVTVFGLALLVMLATPTVSANEYYLLPDDSSVTDCGSYTNVGIWLNATQGIFVGLFNITYDSNCADMTSFTWNGTCFVDAPIVRVPGVTCSYANMPCGMPIISPCTPGLVHLGDFEICCNMTTLPGQTVLMFDMGGDDAVTSLDALMILQAVDQEG